MRAAVSDAAIVGTGKNLGDISGICLGYEHAAEHEWGVKDLYNKFGITDKVKKLFGKPKQLLGFDAHKINKGSFHLFTTITKVDGEDIPVIGLTSQDEVDFGNLDHWMQRMFHDDDLDIDYWTAWSSDDFIVIMKGDMNSYAFRLLEKLRAAAVEKDIAIFLNGRETPFSGTGLCIAIYSMLPKDHMQKVADEHKAQLAVDARRDAMPAYKAWKAKKEEWAKLHPGCDSPWTACSFSTARLASDTGELIIWLNPDHQQHCNFGWLNEAAIWDWVNGIPGAVIKSKELWDELNWMCLHQYSFSVGYELHLYNRHPAEYLLDPGQVYQPDWNDPKTRQVGKGFPKKMLMAGSDKWDRKRLTPEMVKVVEGHIKWKLLEDYRKQVQYRDEKAETVTGPTKECGDEIWGFFECLRKMGLETIRNGASNTPQERENFGWWKGMLEKEALFEFWIEKGVAYEPWVKNGYSEFMKDTFLRYKANGFHDQDDEYEPLEEKLEQEE